jgi:hypothetical protein
MKMNQNDLYHKVNSLMGITVREPDGYTTHISPPGKLKLNGMFVSLCGKQLESKRVTNLTTVKGDINCPDCKRIAAEKLAVSTAEFDINLHFNEDQVAAITNLASEIATR